MSEREASARDVGARDGLKILASLHFEKVQDETGGDARETAAAGETATAARKAVTRERASSACPSGEINESWFVSPAGLPLLTEKQRVAAREVAARKADEAGATRTTAARSPHLERYHLNKDHADRGKQFKPFAALRGYEQLVEREIQRANRERDFTKPEESC